MDTEKKWYENWADGMGSFRQAASRWLLDFSNLLSGDLSLAGGALALPALPAVLLGLSLYLVGLANGLAWQYSLAIGGLMGIVVEFFGQALAKSALAAYEDARRELGSWVEFKVNMAWVLGYITIVAVGIWWMDNLPVEYQVAGYLAPFMTTGFYMSRSFLTYSNQRRAEAAVQLAEKQGQENQLAAARIQAETKRMLDAVQREDDLERAKAEADNQIKVMKVEAKLARATEKLSGQRMSKADRLAQLQQLMSEHPDWSQAQWANEMGVDRAVVTRLMPELNGKR